MIHLGSRVTRSVSHSIEHIVDNIGSEMIRTRCGERIRKRLAYEVQETRGEIYQCQGCNYGEMLHENTQATTPRASA